jgi:hypothetical protein
MNGFIEGNGYSASVTNPDDSAKHPGYRAYNKSTDFIDPSPSLLFVFLDEHADSINDGFMITDPTQNSTWEDMPASYHGQSCCFSFADGHNEIHKWRSGATCIPVTKTTLTKPPVGTDKEDNTWMKLHATAPL